MVEELKFKSIEIKSFRGIKDLTLDLQNKSLVICGPNGTGKSSIIQAFEYLFTEKISALSTVRGKTHVIHKGDKKEDLLIKATIGDKTIERTYSNGGDFGEFTDLKEDFENGSFLLNRKKLLSFIDTQSGKRYEELIKLISYGNYDKIKKGLKKGAENISKEKNGKEKEIESLYNEICSYYNCEKNEILPHINNILNINGIEEINYTILEDDENEEIHYESDLKEFMKENNLVDSSKIFNIDFAIVNEKYIELLDDYEDLVISEMKSTNSLLTILNESKEYIMSEKPTKCPVCHNHINTKSLIEEITPQIDEINKGLNSFKIWEVRNNKLIDELIEINYELKEFNSKNSRFKLDYDLTDLSKSLKKLSNYEIKISEMDKEILFNLYEDIKSLNEKYDLNRNNLSRTLDNIFKLIEIEEIKKDIKTLENQVEKSNKIYKIFDDLLTEELKEILENIINLIARYYNHIHLDEDIKNPNMELTRSTSLELKLYFDEESSDPRKFSSEGHVDSLGLCIFLAFAKKYNKYGFIILDDIISTVDLEHKEQIIRLLFEEFSDYTFIITTHNKLWFEQLSRLSKTYKKPEFNFVEITKWDKDNGPKLSNYMTSKEIIDNYIEEGNIEFAGNSIRKYFEDVLHNICEANEVSLPLLKHYSADNYLSRLKKFQKEIFKGTEYESYYANIFKELDNVTYMGNLLSHRNEDSKDLRLNDIIKYRKAVYKLEDAFKCEDDGKYLKFNKKKKYGVCTNEECDYILFLKSKPKTEIISNINEERKNVYIAKGLDFIKDKDYKKALKTFDKAMESNQNDGDLVTYKLICHRELNEEESAKKCECQILKDNTENALNNIINVYLSLDKPDKALSYMDELIKMNDDVKEFKAALLYELEKYDESIELSKEILQKKQENVKILNILGNNYIKLEMYEEAIEYLLESFNLDSNNIETINSLGFSYYSIDDFENAYSYLKKSLEIDEKNEKTLEYLTHTSLLLKKYEDTINYANRLLIISENYHDIFNDLAIVYFELGDHINGFECLSLAAIAKETKEGFWISKGSYLSSQDKIPEAEECFKKAFEINPNNMGLLIARTEHYKKIGNEKKAKKEYKKLLNLNPNYSISFEDM